MSSGGGTLWIQRAIALDPRSRGFHLITGEVLRSLPELESMAAGMLHLLIQHTSASLTLSRERLARRPAGLREPGSTRPFPKRASYWTHTLEGDDDMPAHIKAALLGPSLTLPISRGRPALGTWQGIYLCEHRDHGGPRRLVATAWGAASA